MSSSIYFDENQIILWSANSIPSQNHFQIMR